VREAIFISGLLVLLLAPFFAGAAFGEPLQNWVDENTGFSSGESKIFWFLAFQCIGAWYGFYETEKKIDRKLNAILNRLAELERNAR
jgi:hypothetical protein